MAIEEFNEFRLVGGTSLSLQIGHRESVDIDLFTDSKYGSIDFDKLEIVLREAFPYVDSFSVGTVDFGKSYYIGNTEDDLVKLDLFYTDNFAFPCVVEQNIRFLDLREIAAMKLEVISGGGRKKDFWDVHELLELFSLNEMIDFYIKRNPYGHTKDKLLTKIIDFSVAEDDFTPNCYKDKIWEIIKLDLEDLIIPIIL